MSTPLQLKSNWRECRGNLVSDWAILNDTTSRKLRKMAVHFYTDIEIEQMSHLLESYHAIYRHNLLQLRRQGYRGKSPLPTTPQLQQIAQDLQSKSAQNYSPQQVMEQLQEIAQKLRQWQCCVYLNKSLSWESGKESE
ncbi:MAG TPA: hypothetical protein V6D37_17845 [Candidatus Sericytochromatia bacterium]|jgi:hypothetical protein